MFKLIGTFLALYTVVCAVRGEVFAKSGVWGRTIERSTSPAYFWCVICIYAGLSIALFVVF